MSTPLISIIKPSTIALLPNGVSLRALSLITDIHGFDHITARATYLFGIPSQNALSAHRSALHHLKSIAAEIGTTITNLDSYEPMCPDCQSRMVSISGDKAYCIICQHDRAISDFYVGGINPAFLERASNNLHSQKEI